MKEKITFEEYDAPFDEKIQNRIIRFFMTLNNEQELFTLSVDKVQKAEQLTLIINNEGKMLGVGGVRKQFIGFLYFMVVHEKYQGQGYGKKLMNKVLSRIKETQLLLLTVQRSNIKARRLYRTLDFFTLHRYKSNAYMLHNNSIGRLLKIPLTLLIAIKARL